MPSLNSSRTDFLAEVGSTIQAAELERFTGALDDFINWSETRQNDVVFVDHEYEQNVVSFREITTRYVLWSAYPKKNGGAKFEILPGFTSELQPDMRQRALTILKSLTREPLNDSTTLRIPFAALKKQSSRDQIKELLSALLADIKGGTALISGKASVRKF